ncbi:MAG: ABC transporter ATP-binding protein [Candidatus Hodarchaeota archaeon]
MSSKKKESINDKERLDIKGSLKILKRLIEYIGKGNKRLFIPLIIIIIFNIVLNWCNPLVFKSLVDDGLGGGIGETEGNLEIVFILGILFFILTVSGVLTRISQSFIIQKLATITMFNLRSELFVKFQSLGLDYHESSDHTTGKKINYLTGDVNTIQQLIQSGLLVSIGNFFLVFGALFFMIALSPSLTLVTFLIVPVVFVFASILFRKAKKYFKELRERISDVTSILDESIMGMRIIQAFAVEDENYREFKNATELERKTTVKAAKLMAFIPGISLLVITLGISILFLSSGFLIREGTLSQGTLLAFIFYIFMFFEPLLSIISFLTVLQNSLAAGARIISLLDEDLSIKEKENAFILEKVEGVIEYQNVNFSYEMGIPVLNNINLTIKEKERLALVGYTGAGKSTFIKLLSRFYDPTEGAIKVDGIDLRDVNLKSLRDKMGIVLQENFLFSGTILDNIRYGNLRANDEEVIKAAKKVNAHEFIINLEKRYYTVVGERGSKLSEGQKQLIAFARALIADPPILILDEATSSIDPYSELLIQNALETLLKGRTSVSIAHRLSTIINSDRIIVLDKGRVIEEGTHEELVKLNGFYNHLYKMQFKDPFKKDKNVIFEDFKKEDQPKDLFNDKQRFSRFF